MKEYCNYILMMMILVITKRLDILKQVTKITDTPEKIFILINGFAEMLSLIKK